MIITVNPPATLANTNGDTIDVLALTLDGGPIRSIDPVTRAFFVGVGGILMLNAEPARRRLFGQLLGDGPISMTLWRRGRHPN